MPRLILILLALTLSSAATAQEMRDPTRPYKPAVVKKAFKPSFVVNAIFVSSRRQVAVINGQRVSVGDDIDGATVTDIQKHQITLEMDGQAFTAAMKRKR